MASNHNFRSQQKLRILPPPGLPPGSAKPFALPSPTCLVNGKGLLQQAEAAQGVPVRLRPRIFLTFGTTRVVGRQPYTPAAFIPGEIPGAHF